MGKAIAIGEIIFILKEMWDSTSDFFMESIPNDFYKSILPQASNMLKMNERYYPIITAEENVLSELTAIARYVVTNKPDHLYIHCENDASFRSLRQNYSSYLYAVIHSAYPSVQMTILSYSSFRTLSFVISY